MFTKCIAYSGIKFASIFGNFLKRAYNLTDILAGRPKMKKFQKISHYINLLAAIRPLMGLFLLIILTTPNIIWAEILWSSNHETGDLSDWYKNQSGAVYNTGGSDASVTVTNTAAHSGTYAVKMEVWNIDTSKRACRIFRWAEHLQSGYFSCWLMFPTLPTVNGWLNIFQFKKKNWETGAVDPTWYNEAKNKSQETTLTLTHWEQEWNISPNINSSPALKAGEWFHVEWYYKDGVNDGELRIWINGIEVWNLTNVNTRGIDPDIQWAPSLYGINVQPGHLVMYMDDAVISSEKVGPNYFFSNEISAPQNLRVVLNQP